jgi:hypothetical protein
MVLMSVFLLNSPEPSNPTFTGTTRRISFQDTEEITWLSTFQTVWFLSNISDIIFFRGNLMCQMNMPSQRMSMFPLSMTNLASNHNQLFIKWNRKAMRKLLTFN